MHKRRLNWWKSAMLLQLLNYLSYLPLSCARILRARYRHASRRRRVQCCRTGIGRSHQRPLAPSTCTLARGSWLLRWSKRCTWNIESSGNGGAGIGGGNKIILVDLHTLKAVVIINWHNNTIQMGTSHLKGCTLPVLLPMRNTWPMIDQFDSLLSTFSNKQVLKFWYRDVKSLKLTRGHRDGRQGEAHGGGSLQRRWRCQCAWQ